LHNQPTSRTQTFPARLLEAAAFAAHKHRFQRRKNEEASPYVNHCLRVAELVATTGGIDDLDVLAAALLHDTLQDTETTAVELERTFGRRVRVLVEAVTDDKTLSKEERKRRQVAHAHELPPDVVLIKLADKIANVEDIARSPPKDWSMARQLEYLDWAEAVVSNCEPVNLTLLDAFTSALTLARRTVV
jgi:guanosine-3',5'-bis(diphosphate) 3'-pyrophosphohydrolase